MNYFPVFYILPRVKAAKRKKKKIVVRPPRLTSSCQNSFLASEVWYVRSPYLKSLFFLLPLTNKNVLTTYNGYLRTHIYRFIHTYDYDNLCQSERQTCDSSRAHPTDPRSHPPDPRSHIPDPPFPEPPRPMPEAPRQIYVQHSFDNLHPIIKLRRKNYIVKYILIKKSSDVNFFLFGGLLYSLFIGTNIHYTYLAFFKRNQAFCPIQLYMVNVQIPYCEHYSRFFIRYQGVYQETTVHFF